MSSAHEQPRIVRAYAQRHNQRTLYEKVTDPLHKGDDYLIVMLRIGDDPVSARNVYVDARINLQSLKRSTGGQPGYELEGHLQLGDKAPDDLKKLYHGRKVRGKFEEAGIGELTFSQRGRPRKA